MKYFVICLVLMLSGVGFYHDFKFDSSNFGPLPDGWEFVETTNLGDIYKVTDKLYKYVEFEKFDTMHLRGYVIKDIIGVVSSKVVCRKCGDLVPYVTIAKTFSQSKKK